MKSQIFLLKVNSIVHAYFTLSSIFSIIFVSVGVNNSIVDFGAFITFFSFLFFKRCVLIDIHQFIKRDLVDLPYAARDSFTRDVMKKIVDKIMYNNEPEMDDNIKTKVQDSRMDVLVNVEPFITEADPLIIQDMYNRKIQYIAGNLVMGCFLMKKYNFNWFPIFLMIWIMNTFPL